MATTLAGDQPLLAANPDYLSSEQNDPFLSPSSGSHHRFSHFDNQLFALGSAASPDQAKRALEAHLAETERRIQDASKLGTTLVQQRKELSERLKEVEKQQNEGDITPELRQRLVEIEKEYNEVGRESARAFLPKSRVSSNEMGESPFNQKRSASPSKFESLSTNSPSKLSVPNRKQRNQPSNRVHDIEFATEISTSLLSQVRHLQALLAEKEDTLRTITLEKSRLEAEAEGFNQRLRSLDESEHRYKDENWNLETQIHEHIAKAKEAASKEQKLTQNLNVAQAEKTAAQKELDEIKLSHAKLSEEHATTVKHHEAELGSAKRTITKAENERGALQRKIEDLTGQNSELAKAVAHQRGRLEDRDQQRRVSDEDFDTQKDNNTPEHSPPPSPVKNTPRHSMLETETLRTSLNHALRMIQNLKGTVHREKTEKLQLNRLLQDARDELDSRRSEIGSANAKRSRKVESREFKKPLRPAQLGGPRRSREEVFIEDPDWEEDNGQPSPTRSTAAPARSPVGFTSPRVLPSSFTDSSDHFETANEMGETTDAFETANERGTETEDFQTGVEEMSGSSDELTETETSGPAGKLRQRPPPLGLTLPGNRESYRSTASLSGDEYSYEGYEEVRTPTASQPQRLRLKASRGVGRMSRAASEEPQFQSSPASFANSSRNGTPAQGGQSLFAELGDLDGSDEESALGTPSRSLYNSQIGTPSSRPSTARNMPFSPSPPPPMPKLPMVDSGMMTEPWVPEPVKETAPIPEIDSLPEMEPSTPKTAVPFFAGGVAGAGFAEGAHFLNDKRVSTGSQAGIHVSDSGSQWLDERVSTGSQAGVQMTDSGIQWHDERVSTGSQTGGKMTDSGSQWHDERVSTGSQAGVETTDAGSQWIDKRVSTGSQAGIETADSASQWQDLRVSTGSQAGVQTSDAGSQWHEELIDEFLKVESDESRPISTSTYSDMSSQYDPEMLEENLAKFPSPPSSRAHTPLVNLGSIENLTSPSRLGFSSIISEHVEPSQPEPEIVVSPSRLAFSSIISEHFEPSDPEPKVEEEPIEEEPAKSIQEEAASSTRELPLAFSSLQFVDTEPIEPRSPKRYGVIIPRDDSDEEMKPEPETPKANVFLPSIIVWNKGKAPATPIIAEDETRQSPSNSPLIDTSDFQRPSKEISNNLHDRAAKKTKAETSEQASQTALTAEQIDEMLRAKQSTPALVVSDSQKSSAQARGLVLPSALGSQRSQESLNGVVFAKSTASPAVFSDAGAMKPPSSADSMRNNSMTSSHPPLPTDHKQAIAAASQRSGSSGTPGSMGPPLMTAAAYRAANPSFRPRTPNSSQPLSPGSIRAGTTPRPMHSSGTHGTADVHSPVRLGTGRSRGSSVSSFVSEVDNRFGLRQGMMMPQGVEPITDPRMINAITQTMIGEYLWKYTRKAGRGAMSENRHRRYFWVHPYTRTLYWSDNDPSSANRAEVKAKSVPIEAVRVVTDDNPMPPGLHRKSLVIVTPGRSIKFTAATGQRHETWFNALSYLLLRTGEDAVGDTADVASGALTSEDVAEFNPGYGANSSTRRGPASLSSYNSRTTRNESPARAASRISQNPPTLTPSSRPALGTFGRLSSYWPAKEVKSQAGTFSSKRSRHSLSNTNQGSIYEASEVHDSAEDLRVMIEKQDRESDKLENVRACCDGKHDVGHLHSSTRSRHPQQPQQTGGPSSTQPSVNKSRNSSLIRRTE